MLKFVLLSVIVLLNQPLEAQQKAKKFPGEPAEFNFTFPVANEPNITGFRLYGGATAQGPFSVMVVEIAPNLRTVTVPTTYPPGAVRMFFVVRSYLTVGTETMEATESNVVEVEMNVPSATGLQVK